MEPLADSLAGEVLGATPRREGRGPDVALRPPPHGLALRPTVEVSEHSDMRLRAEQLVFERPEPEVRLLVVEVITVMTSAALHLAGPAQLPGEVVPVVPHAVEGPAQELHLSGDLQQFDVPPATHKPPLPLILAQTPLIDLAGPDLPHWPEECEDWDLRQPVRCDVCGGAQTARHEDVVVILLSSLQLTAESLTVWTIAVLGSDTEPRHLGQIGVRK